MLSSLFRKQTNCCFNKFSIKLPPGHKLPKYQKSHPRYDRFLPHLAKFFKSSDVVIDVGANVGDTLAGMVDVNPTLHFICIEPDDIFYKYLISNVKIIKDIYPELRIDLVKSLVGKDVTNVELVGVGGTKHASVTNASGLQSITLDAIIKNLDSPPVRLLKTDVDGYDYDVLDSSIILLQESKPIVFFECQYDRANQIECYKNTIIKLEDVGYKDYTIFDNFGAVVLRTSDSTVLFQLIDYVANQNEKTASRTIYYLDVLAVTPDDSHFIDKVLLEY